MYHWNIESRIHVLFPLCINLSNLFPNMYFIPGGLALAIEGPSKAKINCVDNKDGTCSVTYFPTKPGQYEIVVKFADKNIPGSPFKAQIVGKYSVWINWKTWLDIRLKRSFFEFMKRKHRYTWNTDMEGRSQTSYTTPCNGVVNHGAPIGGIRVLTDHSRDNKRKQKAAWSSRACVRWFPMWCDFSCVFIFTRKL